MTTQLQTPNFPLVPPLISDEPLQFELDNRIPSLTSMKILASHSSQDDFQSSHQNSNPLRELLPPRDISARESDIDNNLMPVALANNKTGDTFNGVETLKSTNSSVSTPNTEVPPILIDTDGSISSSPSTPNNQIPTFPINIDASSSTPNRVVIPPPSVIPPDVHIASNNIAQSKSQQISKKGRIVRVVRPFVYSAIGSLECVNQNSLGSFNRKLCLASKEKVKIGGRVKSNLGYHPKKIDNGNEGHNLFNSLGLDELRDQQTGPSPSTLTILPNQNQHIRKQSGDETCSHIQDNSGDKIVKMREDISLSSFQQPSISKDDNSVKAKRELREKKRVTIDTKPKRIRPVEVFRPSCDAYTTRMGKREIKYKPAKERASMERISTPMGTIQRPNFRDALRRVAIIIHKHIVKIERRFAVGVPGLDNAGLFTPAMRDTFAEDNFATPRYKCNMVNIPMARPGIIYGMRKIETKYNIPTASDIYEFAHQIFNSVQLSSECSIICLIYVERLMEVAKVPVMSNTWRPIFMCGLLLASKVWQDWSSWNVEFASVYPQFTLNSINRLEVQFLKMLKWNFYISPSLYAKYYFALRSLLEKQDFRHKYNRMVGADSRAALEAIKVSKRSEVVKQEALLHLSKSM